jgi:broad specificity phosphatase PhoE
VSQKTTIYFIRHGKTGKAKEDGNRKLTRKGQRQAKKLGESLRDVRFDLVLSSTAQRCIQTARNILGDKSQTIIINADLYVPGIETPDGKAIDTAFNQIGYQSYTAYMKTEARDGLSRYGQKNADTIEQIIQDQAVPPQNVLVVGHAVLLQAIAAKFAADEDDLPFHINIGEAEGIEVTIETGGVALIK